MFVRSRFGLVWILLFALGGCIPPAFVTRPNIDQRVPQLKKITLLPPRVDVYEIGAGGVLEKMDDWSRSGSQNVLQALDSELRQRQTVEVSSVDSAKLSDDLKAELEQTQLMFDAVSASVVTHVYGAPHQRFEDKWTNFDYSLGGETARLNVDDVDAFVIAKGIDQISSAGRQAVQLGTVLAAAALGIVVIPQPGITAMNVALVDARNGEILWYVSNRSASGHDLRNPASAAAFVKIVLNGFPIK